MNITETSTQLHNAFLDDPRRECWSAWNATLRINTPHEISKFDTPEQHSNYIDIPVELCNTVKIDDDRWSITARVFIPAYRIRHTYYMVAPIHWAGINVFSPEFTPYSGAVETKNDEKYRCIEKIYYGDSGEALILHAQAHIIGAFREIEARLSNKTPTIGCLYARTDKPIIMVSSIINVPSVGQIVLYDQRLKYEREVKGILLSEWESFGYTPYTEGVVEPDDDDEEENDDRTYTEWKKKK